MVFWFRGSRGRVHGHRPLARNLNSYKLVKYCDTSILLPSIQRYRVNKTVRVRALIVA